MSKGTFINDVTHIKRSGGGGIFATQVHKASDRGREEGGHSGPNRNKMCNICEITTEVLHITK